MNYNETIDIISEYAISKVDLIKDNPLKYIVSAIYAGIFIGLGVLVSFTLNGIFIEGGDPHFGRLLNACVFSVALTLIIFTGTELFTGNTFVMTICTLNKKSRISSMLKILFTSWIGNLIGSIILATLYTQTGLLENKSVLDFFVYTSRLKATLPIEQLFFRAVLCNFIVCLAIMVSTRTKNDAAKILTTILLIVTFVVSGFEHSIANMSVYSIAIIGNIGSISISQAAYALIVATVGNFVGGAILLGFGVFFLKK